MQNLRLHLDMFRLGSGNFVNQTQTESESEIPRNKKVKKNAFLCLHIRLNYVTSCLRNYGKG